MVDLHTREEVLSHPSIVLFKMIGSGAMTEDVHEEIGVVRIGTQPCGDLVEKVFVVLHVFEHLSTTSA